MADGPDLEQRDVNELNNHVTVNLNFNTCISLISRTWNRSGILQIYLGIPISYCKRNTRLI